MEENKTKISFTEFMDDVEANCDAVKTVRWYGRDIEVKKYLTLLEVLLFVTDVVDVCYQYEDDNFVYKPEVQAYAIKHTLVSLYTNIDLGESESDDSDVGYSAYDFITRSGVCDMILSEINIEQYEAILEAISAKIKYINEANSAAIMSEIVTLNSTINDVIPQIQEFFNDDNKNKLSDMLHVLNTFTDDATIRKLAMEQIKNG